MKLPSDVTSCAPGGDERNYAAAAMLPASFLFHLQGGSWSFAGLDPAIHQSDYYLTRLHLRPHETVSRDKERASRWIKAVQHRHPLLEGEAWAAFGRRSQSLRTPTRSVGYAPKRKRGERGGVK